MSACLVLVLAVCLDLALGDPPNRWHPVAWMGSLILAVRKRAPKRGVWLPLLVGCALLAGGVVCCAALGWLVQSSWIWLPAWAAITAQAVVLKCTFSIRGLLSAGRRVHAALVKRDLPEARRLVSWHLVSRDTSGLNESQLSAATIESLAENLSDSIVAPLVFYLLAGLPGALAYRFLNTCDAMLGYHDAELEWLGKVPARIDDVANLLPARLSALAIVLASPLCGANAWTALAVWRRDRRLTASPNAGQPMSAAAGALGVQLEKMGHYRLGGGLRLPEAPDVMHAVWLVACAAALACLGCGACLLIQGTF